LITRISDSPSIRRMNKRYVTKKRLIRPSVDTICGRPSCRAFHTASVRSSHNNKQNNVTKNCMLGQPTH